MRDKAIALTLALFIVFSLLALISDNVVFALITVPLGVVYMGLMLADLFE